MAKSQKIRSGNVKVDGLRELNAALRKISKDAQKELREASRGVAEFVAADARSAATTEGSTLGHIAPSIKAVGGVSGAGVAFGGAAWPMAGGAEFGAYKFKQFKPWRGNGAEAGYAVFPTIRRDEPKIVDEFTDAIDALLRRNRLI